MSGATKILIIDDNADDRLLYRRALARGVVPADAPDMAIEVATISEMAVIFMARCYQADAEVRHLPRGQLLSLKLS